MLRVNAVVSAETEATARFSFGPLERMSAEAHASAISSGFALDATSGCYYNSESGLCYDARSGLYWHAGQHESGPFYRYDADGGFVLADGAGGADGAGQAEA